MSDRPLRLLWACPYCLLDTSSGASIAIRELLFQLKTMGWDIYILGSTVFDSEAGTLRLRKDWATIQTHIGKMINVTDGPLEHHLIPVKSTNRFAMTTQEEDIFLGTYTSLLDKFKPDLVFTYGGHGLDYLIADEAADRGIPMTTFLVNGNYQAKRWCRDIDMILTDSNATADFYAERQGFRPKVFGAPINPNAVLAEKHFRKNVLFINPSYAKGVGITITLALLLEDKRPDITFEIIESRGSWKEVLSAVTKTFGYERKSLKNVIVTPHTTDMRPIYGRARILLAPSLWYESFGRVSAEAMMNGIPAIVSNRGGLPEVTGDGAIKVDFPKECYEPPYTRLVAPNVLQPVVDIIERFYDDEAFYEQYCKRALAQGRRYVASTVAKRFIEVVKPLTDKRAGDRDLNSPRLRPNKQVQEKPKEQSSPQEAESAKEEKDTL